MPNGWDEPPHTAPPAGARHIWRSRRARLLAAALTLGVLYLWLTPSSTSLRPAQHNFVSVNGTQAAFLTQPCVACPRTCSPTG